MNLKICGMKFRDNLDEIVKLEPDYLGFIFYPKSPRYFNLKTYDLPENIKKVGVFVNESFAEIIRKIYTHDLNVVQIHGNESEEYCKELKDYYPGLKVWKAFAINEEFDFEQLKNYEEIDAFLFDTKGKNYGGNGVKFNWELLKNYNSNKEIILSGGISVEDVPLIFEIQKDIPQIQTIDINSRFEIEPGLKNLELVKEFYEKLKILK